MQAKDLDDKAMLRVVLGISMGWLKRHFKLDGGYDCRPDSWVFTWDIRDQYSDVPEKVLVAKLNKLVKRGLLDGCTCGCRGDFWVTPKGHEFLANA
jgi:hypothetical protein